MCTAGLPGRHPRGSRARRRTSGSALSIGSAIAAAPRVADADRDARTRSTTCSPPPTEHARLTGLVADVGGHAARRRQRLRRRRARARRACARVRGGDRPPAAASRSSRTTRSATAIRSGARRARRSSAPRSACRAIAATPAARDVGAACGQLALALIARAHASGARHRGPGRHRRRSSRRVIEIPRGSHLKYEVDKPTGLLAPRPRALQRGVLPGELRVHPAHARRRRRSARHPRAMQEPVEPLTIVRARALGGLRMADDKGGDDKIIAVCIDDPAYAHVRDARAAAAARDEGARSVLPRLQDPRGASGSTSRSSTAGRGARDHRRSRALRTIAAKDARRLAFALGRSLTRLCHAARCGCVAASMRMSRPCRSRSRTAR